MTCYWLTRRKPIALKQDIDVQLDENYSVKFKARSYELQLIFSCEGCQMGLSLLHGAMMPVVDGANCSPGVQQHRQVLDDQCSTAAGAAASEKAATAASKSGRSDVAQAGVGTQDLLARARALMAADFSEMIGSSSDAGSAQLSAGISSSSTCTATGVAAAATVSDEADSTQQLLDRARALIAANGNS